MYNIYDYILYIFYTYIDYIYYIYRLLYVLYTRCNNQKFYPKKVLLGKETISNSKLIAKNFNNFFTETGPKLAREIEKPAKTFDVYLKKVDILQPDYPSSI